MLISAHNLIQNLTIGHIIALTFFSVLIITSFIAIIIFLIYRQQVKYVLKIDDLIEIIDRFPIPQKIMILKKNNEKAKSVFNDQIEICEGNYLKIMQGEYGFNYWLNIFTDQLDNNECFKISIKNLRRLCFLYKQLEICYFSLISLNEKINVFLTNEISMRNLAIDVHKQINFIKNWYKQNVFQFGIENNLDENYFDEALKSTFQSLNDFEVSLKIHDFQQSQTALIAFINKGIYLNFDVSYYPLIKQYLDETLSEHLEIISNKIFLYKDSFQVNKQNFDELISEINENVAEAQKALKVNDIHEANNQIRYVEKLLIEFDQNLVFEERIKAYLTSNLDEFLSLLNSIVKVCQDLEIEENVVYKRKNLNKNLIEPSKKIIGSLLILNIERNLGKLKRDIQKNLSTILDNFGLIETFKPNIIKSEDLYRQYLDLNFRSKTNITFTRQLLDEDKWLKPTQITNYLSLTNFYANKLNDYELNDLGSFQNSSYNLNNAILNIKELRNLDNQIYDLTSQIRYRYLTYRIASALIPYIEINAINNKTYNNIIETIIKNFDDKQYLRIIDIFIKSNNLTK